MDVKTSDFPVWPDGDQGLGFSLPDGVSGRAGNGRGRRREAAVAMEILDGATPGRVDGAHLAAGVRLLAIKPEQIRKVKGHSPKTPNLETVGRDLTHVTAY